MSRNSSSSAPPRARSPMAAARWCTWTGRIMTRPLRLRLRRTPPRLSQPKRKANRKDLVRGAGGAEAARPEGGGEGQRQPHAHAQAHAHTHADEHEDEEEHDEREESGAESAGEESRTAEAKGENGGQNRKGPRRRGRRGGRRGRSGQRPQQSAGERRSAATLRPRRFSTKRLGPPARATSGKMAPGGRSVPTRLRRKRFNNRIMRLNACSQAPPGPARNRQPAASLASKAQPSPSCHAAEDGGSARVSVLAGHCRGLMSAS